MSWAKESSKVGLAGLTPLEAARGAMFVPLFQEMPDPLKQEEVEIASADNIPLVSVSISFKLACLECRNGSLRVQYSTM